ncbi:MAG: hypothetical protein L0Y80_12125 [Ignavibacteriae bacterium]|nr:hypothetical protein [Ignavibacteriota bacterium]
MKFVARISIILTLLGLGSCKDGPPSSACRICPRDFRVTDFEPAWSPDGTTIAFVRGDSSPAKTGIYLINFDGTNIRLWHASVGAYTPTWSPDNQWIAFSDGGQIFKKKVNGDSLTQLTSAGGNYFPDWSPDGRWIVFDSNNESPNGMNFVWRMQPDGLNKVRISYEPTQGEVRMPSWSLDATKIAHIRYFVGTFSSEIVLMDSNGANTLRLTINNATDTYPRYSPDGAKIAFTSQAENGYTQIWVINSDGTNPQQLTTTQGYTCDWSPDGEWIVFTDSRSVSGRLWLMRKDGSEKQQLTFDEGGG